IFEAFGCSESPLLAPKSRRKLNRQFHSSLSRTVMSQRVQVFAWKFWKALGAVSLLAFAGALIISSKRLPVSYQIGLWGLWIIVLAFLFRRGWIRLFGPVLIYDLVRTGRRTRNILLRCLYALALFLMVYTVYLEFADNIKSIQVGSLRYRYDVDPVQAKNQLMIKEMA